MNTNKKIIPIITENDSEEYHDDCFDGIRLLMPSIAPYIPHPSICGTKQMADAVISFLETKNPTCYRLILLGEGSGYLAVKLALTYRAISITATDIFPKAVQTITKNVRIHKIADRVDIFQSDLFDSIPVEDKKKVVIIFTPPQTAKKFRESRADEFNAETNFTDGDNLATVKKTLMATQKIYGKKANIILLLLTSLLTTEFDTMARESGYQYQIINSQKHIVSPKSFFAINFKILLADGAQFFQKTDHGYAPITADTPVTEKNFEDGIIVYETNAYLFY